MPLRAKLACAIAAPAILAMIFMIRMSLHGDMTGRGLLLRLTLSMILLAAVAAIITHLHHRLSLARQDIRDLQERVEELRGDVQAMHAWTQYQETQAAVPGQRRHLQSTPTPGVR